MRDRDAIDAALAAIDPLDVAIGNAAVGHGIPFLEISPQQWQDHLDVNLTGCFNLGQAAARLMVARGAPRAHHLHRHLGAGGPLARDRRLLGDQSRRAHAGAVDGPRARSLQDPRQRHRPRHRQRRAGASSVGDRAAIRPPRPPRHPARRAADHRPGCPRHGLPLLRRRRLHDRQRPPGRRRLLAVPVRGGRANDGDGETRDGL